MEEGRTEGEGGQAMHTVSRTGWSVLRTVLMLSANGLISSATIPKGSVGHPSGKPALSPHGLMTLSFEVAPCSGTQGNAPIWPFLPKGSISSPTPCAFSRSSSSPWPSTLASILGRSAPLLNRPSGLSSTLCCMRLATVTPAVRPERLLPPSDGANPQAGAAIIAIKAATAPEHLGDMPDNPKTPLGDDALSRTWLVGSFPGRKQQ